MNFEEIKQKQLTWVSGYFCMFDYEISIDDEDIENNYPTIFHEFTHYLQTMCTISGLDDLDTYIRYFSRCFCKLGISQFDITPPVYDFLDRKMGNETFSNLVDRNSLGVTFKDEKYIFPDSSEDDYELTTERFYDSYTTKNLDILCIHIDGKKIPLNKLVIKENMAMMNTLIAKNKDDNISEDDIDEIIAFEYKEYVAIFDFINHLFPGKNIIKLVYQICELSLNVTYSEKMIAQIIYYLNQNAEELNKKNEDEIIQSIKVELEFNAKYVSELNSFNLKAVITFRTLETIIIRDKNEFLEILLNIYRYAFSYINNQSSIWTSLYSSTLNQTYINRFVPEIGAPIIYYKNSKTTKTLSGAPNSFYDDLSYLHGALKLFVKAYFEQVRICPFFEGTICNNTKNENCQDNCFENYGKTGYENCLLANSLICTGLKSKNR